MGELDVLTVVLTREVTDKWERLKKARLNKEKQWAKNLLYLFGHNYVTVTPIKGGAMKGTLDEIVSYAFQEIKNSRAAKTRRSNIILPQWRSLLSRMLKNKAAIVVEPLTFSDRDTSASSVAQEVLEDWWFNVNKHNPFLRDKYAGMYNVLRYVFAYLLTYGECVVRPYFNPDTKTEVVVDDEIIEANVGEVEVLVFNPFDYIWDPLDRYVIERQVMDADYVGAMYNKEVKGKTIRREGIESQLEKVLSYSGIDTQFENAVWVYRYWERPSPKYPDGRLIITTETTLLYEGPLPEEAFGELPHFRFAFQDLLFGDISRGVVEDMIPLQDDYNDTLLKIDKYKAQAGHLLIPRGANIKRAVTEDQTTVIMYNPVGGEPRYMQPGSPPQFLFENLMRIKQDLQDITMTHDVTKARVPANVRSGYAIQLLQEKDEDELEPYLTAFEDKLSTMCEFVLKMMKRFYGEERILRIAGEGKALEVRRFTGSDLGGPWRIKIEFGSWLPQSKQARQEMVVKLVQFGILTPQEAKKLLPLGKLDENIMPPDYTKAKEELQLLIDGIADYIEVKPYDNHKIHADVFRDYMETMEFEKLPPMTKIAIEQHFMEHIRAMAEQMPPTPSEGVAQTQGGIR